MSNILSRNVRWLSELAVSKFQKRDPDLWGFGEWMGNRCCDNSLSLANYIVENHPDKKVVWFTKKGADLSLLDPRIDVIEIDSAEADAALKQIGVAVMNQGKVDFGKDMNLLCNGAVTVQLWHGAPWKKIGMDMIGPESFLRHCYREYIQKLNRADMHLALSDDFADILESAFLAKREGIILAGYPRNAIFYDVQRVRAAREKVISLLCREHPVTDQTKIITYMPTFRDKTEEVFSFDKLSDDPRLKQILEEHDAVIVQKAHFVSYQRNKDANASCDARIFSLNDVSAQELLAATDLLITDYSSCFFDYLLLDRPIIHYIYDYDYYAGEDRGVYYKAEDIVCGDAPKTTDQLLDALEANLRAPGLRKELRKERRQKYITYESADSCEIIYQQVLARQSVRK